jgi:hypothetical protein
VFASDKGLQILACCGHLTLMDSTHNSNKLKWYLTTLMVRDEHHSWIPAVYFLHNKQDSEVLAASLRQIKQWCRQKWQLRYIITDDSAGEQTAIKKAFRGLGEGEQEVRSFALYSPFSANFTASFFQKYRGSEAP